MTTSIAVLMIFYIAAALSHLGGSPCDESVAPHAQQLPRYPSCVSAMPS